MARLDTGFDSDFFVAFQRWHGDDAAQHCGNDIQLGTDYYIVTASSEHSVGLHVDTDVQVARVSTIFTYVTLSPHDDACSVVDSGRDVDRDFAAMVPYARGVALVTRSVDFGSGAAARGTFADLLEVAEQSALGTSHVSTTVTSWTGSGCATGLTAGTAAPRTDFASHHVGFAASAENGIAERYA